MSYDSRPFAVTLLIGSLRFIPVVAAGAFFIYWGLGVQKYDERGVDSFSLIAWGAMLLFGGLFGLMFYVMKRRAPARADERLTEADDVTFDVDAAMERYLAERGPGSTDAPPANVINPPRPVFGRKAA
jgi:hypothetical protein